MRFDTSIKTLAAAALLAGLALPAAVNSQPAPTASAPASANAGTNKAGKPPADAAASQSDVATKKPAKPGAQSGAASAPKK